MRKYLVLVVSFAICFSLCACEEMREERKVEYVGTYSEVPDRLGGLGEPTLALYADGTGKYINEYRQGEELHKIVANATWHPGGRGDIVLSIEGTDNIYEYRNGSDQIVEDFSQHTYFREYECKFDKNDRKELLTWWTDYEGRTIWYSWLIKTSDTPLANP